MTKKIGYNSLIIYVAVAIITASVYYFSMKPLTSFHGLELVFDSILTGLLSGVLTFLLKDIVKYGNYASFPFFQRIVNYLALASLFVLLLVGLEFYLLFLLFPNSNIAGSVLPTIPVRITISILLFIIIVLFYEYIFFKKEDETECVEVITDNEDSEFYKRKLETTESLERLAVRNGQKIDVIPVSDVICFQAEGDYVMIYSTAGKFLKEETMKYFQSHLPSNKFVRVHRSSIINVDFISKIELFEKQVQIVRLHNNLQVKMSLSGYKLLKETLGL